jgi:hypothetical protein
MYYNNQYPTIVQQNNNFMLQTESTASKRIIQGIIDIVGIIVCFVIVIIVYTSLNPKIRYYTCDMSDISLPELDSTIPFYAGTKLFV